MLCKIPSMIDIRILQIFQYLVDSICNWLSFWHFGVVYYVGHRQKLLAQVWPPAKSLFEFCLFILRRSSHLARNNAHYFGRFYVILTLIGCRTDIVLHRPMSDTQPHCVALLLPINRFGSPSNSSSVPQSCHLPQQEHVLQQIQASLHGP